MDEKALLATIFDVAKDDPADVLALGNAHWQEIAARPPTPEDAETCRLIGISAAEVEAFDAGALWRTRAHAIASQIPWPELIAAINISEAFSRLARRNDNYPRGRTLDVIEGSPEAIEIVLSLRAVADGPDSGIVVTPRSPTIALIKRFVLEKTGSFQLALKDIDGAAASFEAAVEHAEGTRGVLKSRGGLALASYLRALNADDATTAAAATAETRAVLGELIAADEDARTIEIARHNAAVMRRGSRDLLLYEIL